MRSAPARVNACHSLPLQCIHSHVTPTTPHPPTTFARRPSTHTIAIQPSAGEGCASRQRYEPLRGRRHAWRLRVKQMVTSTRVREVRRSVSVRESWCVSCACIDLRCSSPMADNLYKETAGKTDQQRVSFGLRWPLNAQPAAHTPWLPHLLVFVCVCGGMWER